MRKSKSKSKSSKGWLDRQSKDRYVADSKKIGYRSRSAFKLNQIDDKFHLLMSGQKVLDLGSSPGGWSQVITKKIQGKGSRLIAID